MLHAKTLAAQTWLAEDNQPLTGGDHLLHVMQIEPTQGDRLAQRAGVRFLQRRFEDFLPAAETAQRSLGHFTANADGHVALIAREASKLAPVFVATREMA